MTKLPYCLIFLGLLAGCSGQLVCEWQTEDEQFEELIEKVIERTGQ